MDIIQELEQKLKERTVAVKELRKSGTAFAAAERDYKVLLRQEVLRLRDDGQAVGVIDKICYGIPSVAEKRFQRDVAKTIYEANLECINATKLYIKILQEQINKEWSNG